MTSRSKIYTVEIEMDSFECEVVAKNITEAKQKALKRLGKRKPSGLVKKDWKTRRKAIWVDEK